MRWILFLTLLLSTTTAHAQEFNAGFVQGLWFDDHAFFVGDTTRIYVAVRNNTGADLTGTVEFFDGDIRIERNNISALNGRIIESWADWTPSYGEHTISATLSRIELHTVGSSTEAVTVTASLAEETIFVDYDTDEDGIGNTADADDDGDGMSDEAEKKNGTDPLVYNEPAPAKETKKISDEDGQETDSTTPQENSNNPQGLEQYLTNSRAETVLGETTSVINETKRQLDQYRAARETRLNTAASDTDDQSVSPAATSSSATTTTASKTPTSSFGTITRTKGESVHFIESITTLLSNIFTATYTVILSLLSLYLSHPIIVQLTLLILILFLIYKIARRFGSRPN